MDSGELFIPTPKHVIGIMGKAGSGKDTVGEMIRGYIGYDKSIKYSFADPLKAMCALVFEIPMVWMYDQDLKTRNVNISTKNPVTIGKMREWVAANIAQVDKWNWHIARPELSGKYEGTRIDQVANAIFSKFDDVVFEKLIPQGLATRITHKVYNLSIRTLLQYMGTDVIRELIDNEFWAEIKSPVSKDSTVVSPDCRFESEVKYIMSQSGSIVIVKNNDLVVDTKHKHESEIFVDLVEDYLIQKNYPFVIIENNLSNDYEITNKQVVNFCERNL